MEPLLLCLIIAACVQHVGTDLAYAVRGKTPPRLEWKMQRAQQRPVTETSSPARRLKRAVGEYFGDLGHDAVRTAHERHRRVYERKQHRRAGKWDAKSHRSAAPQPIVEEPDVPDLQEVAERELDRQWTQAREDTDVETKASTCPECGEQVQEVSPMNWAPAYGERPAWSHLDGEPLCPVVTEHGYQPAQPQQAHSRPQNAATTEPLEGSSEPMSTPTNPTANAETTNLSHALAYTQAMAESAQQGASSAEQSAAHLEAGEVSGQSLAHLASAREHLAQAAAAFTAAHQELSKQTSIRDAYAAVGNDAGSKQFVTAE